MDYRECLDKYNALLNHYGDEGRAWVSLTNRERGVLCYIRPKGFGIILHRAFCERYLNAGYLELPEKEAKLVKKKYFDLCWMHTELNADKIDGIEGRSFKGMHIDRVVPISCGFKVGILPSLIGSVENLRMLHCSDNYLKGSRLTSDSHDILRRWGIEV